MGMNEHGLSIGTTNIKTRDTGLGLGYVNIIDLALKQKTARKASQKIHKLPRLASHTYWAVDDKEGFQIDTGHRFYQNINFNDEALVRTNHPVPQTLAQLQLEVPSKSSLMRKNRAEHLFEVEPQRQMK